MKGSTSEQALPLPQQHSEEEISGNVASSTSYQELPQSQQQKSKKRKRQIHRFLSDSARQKRLKPEPSESTSKRGSVSTDSGARKRKTSKKISVESSSSSSSDDKKEQRKAYLKKLAESEEGVDILTDSNIVPPSTSSAPKIGGTFRLFSERDHNLIRNLYIPLLNRCLRKEKCAKAAEIVEELRDDVMGGHLYQKYGRSNCVEKFKSLYKNELRKKKKQADYYQYPDIQ